MFLVVVALHPLLAFVTGICFRRMRHTVVQKRRDLLEEAQIRLREKQKVVAERRSIGQALEQRVGRIVTLYELSKKMTASLELSEVFLLLQEAARNNLSFERGWLFLTGEADQVPRVEEQFSFSSQKETALEHSRVLQVPPVLETLIQEMSRERGPVRSERVLASPLLVKNELNGFLALEGTPPHGGVPAQEESLSILANQFAPAIQKVKLYQKIQQLAITDGLTRLSSRHYFMERFQEELARSKRYRLSLAFLMADIDHFKEHNDRCGHLVGDVVLREVASLIKVSVREIDLVGRYGGEEFAIVLPDTSLEGALHVAERIRSTIEGHAFAAYDETLHVTLSLGISVYPGNGEDAETLIDTADAALYHAKGAGRNRISTSRLLT